MKKYWSLRFLINVIIFVVIIIIIFVQTVYFSYLSDLIQIQKEKDVSNAIVLVDNYIKNKIDILSQIRESQYYSSSVAEYLKSETELQKKVSTEKIVRAITNIQDFSTDIVYTMGVDRAGESFSFSNNINEVEFEKINSIYAKYANSENYSDSMFYNFFVIDDNVYHELYICVFTPVTEIDYRNVGYIRIGTAISFVKINTLKMLREIKPLNGVELILYNNANSETVSILSTNIKADANSTTKTLGMDSTTWGIKGTLAEGETIFLIKNIRWLTVLEAVFVIFLAILIQIIFTKYITNPIHKLIKYIDKYSLNARNEPLIIDNKFEIGVIVKHFNNMIQKNKNMARDIVRTQQKLFESELGEKEAVLYALQSQINPHFLYNTLDCVRTIAIVRDVAEITEIMTSMSDILRYTISNDTKTTVMEEISIVEKFISIMRIRNPDRFEVFIDVPLEIQQKEIIKMILQPIVENAFKHGLTSNKKMGLLKIRAGIEDGMMKFFIYDNGRGIAKEKYMILNEKFKSDKENWHNATGIGLANINNRIKLNYGSKYGLEIKCKEKEFTEVIVNLPEII